MKCFWNISINFKSMDEKKNICHEFPPKHKSIDTNDEIIMNSPSPPPPHSNKRKNVNENRIWNQFIIHNNTHFSTCVMCRLIHPRSPLWRNICFYKQLFHCHVSLPIRERKRFWESSFMYNKHFMSAFMYHRHPNFPSNHPSKYMST